MWPGTRPGAATPAATASSSPPSPAHPDGAGLVAVRDSKHPGGPALILTAPQAADWIRGLKSGQYDHLIHS
jgi:hypothetical protein